MSINKSILSEFIRLNSSLNGYLCQTGFWKRKWSSSRLIPFTFFCFSYTKKWSFHDSTVYDWKMNSLNQEKPLVIICIAISYYKLHVTIRVWYINFFFLWIILMVKFVHRKVAYTINKSKVRECMCIRIFEYQFLIVNHFIRIKVGTYKHRFVLQCVETEMRYWLCCNNSIKCKVINSLSEFKILMLQLDD